MVVENDICPFCGEEIYHYYRYRLRKGIGYSLYGSTRNGVLQYFHDSCYNRSVKKKEAEEDEKAR